MNDFARPPRVLVVEDDDEIALALQRSLRMEGYDVKIAGDGISALDLAHAFLPDLVRNFVSYSAGSSLGPSLSSMMIYMLMAAVLVFRPEGLFPASSK